MQLLCVFALPVAWAEDGLPPEQSRALGAVAREFCLYDSDGDGVAEIRYIRSLGKRGTDPGSVPRSRRLVLVIVEPRLLREAEGRQSGEGSLRDPLATYAADLAAEGWAVSVQAMQVYDGPVHQDGRTLLAMRAYLREVKAAVPDFAGVVLVGSFPEALLVRQYNWRQHRKTTLNKGKANEERFEDGKVYRIRSVPEIVAGRCELVLADLDGNWSPLYHIGPEQLPWALAVYPDATAPEGDPPLHEWLSGGPTRHYEMGAKTFEDFFLVNDGRFTTEPTPAGGINLRLSDDLPDDECSAEDKQRGNPIARPDVFVSRINARHIALRPKPGVRGINGEGLLDAQGLPQTVTFASEKDTPRGLSVWEHDPELEQRLLVEYFARNHRYRRGEFKAHFKPAAASHGLGSPMNALVAARPEWKDLDRDGYEVHGDDGDLLAVVEWLKRPAVLRALCAHSDPWGATFGKTEDVSALESACGGQPWSWIRKGGKLVPTLGVTGKLDYAITRTLWQNHALPDTASFFLHHGCEALTPGGARRFPYNHPQYAYWQGAEGLLFFCKGLALVGRAKTFYDFPSDFAKEFGGGKTFGEAWAQYFDLESAQADVGKVGGGIGRKRAYFWSILGDWTLRLG